MQIDCFFFLIPLIYCAKWSPQPLFQIARLSLNCLRIALSVIYGDKGHVDKQVKSHLSQYGIKLMFQLRKNMTGYSWFVNYRISRLRMLIETVFSSIEQFGIECLRYRSLEVLKFRTEAIFLTILLCSRTVIMSLV